MNCKADNIGLKVLESRFLELLGEPIHCCFQLERLESHTSTSAHRLTFVNSFVMQEETPSVNHYSRALYETAKEMKKVSNWKATSVGRLIKVNLHLYCFETCEKVGGFQGES